MDNKILDRLLGPLERDVMEVAWKKRAVTVRDVYVTLGKERAIAYTTVLTVMQRLARKGLLDRDTRSTQHLYRARLNPPQFVDESTRRDIEDLLSKYGDAAITHFIKVVASTDPKLLERLGKIASHRHKKA